MALSNLLGCHLISITIKAHWSLIAERYRDALICITNKLIVDYPHAPPALLIYYSNLAMFHTIGAEGFTSTILAFRAQPRLPVGNFTKIPQTV